ncbi:hypothetical protein ACWC98_12090 [Streptomyces goshikiensis]|uniref:hypothetical protein n=1 Tax=Streptomyces goshikiensis TaxID=1942 RepID=UPI0036C1A324
MLRDIEVDGIGVRIARKGIEFATNATPRNYLASLGFAPAICCYKRLVRLTT